MLARWFAYMDSDDPDRVLSMIGADFRMAVLFSRGAGESAEFVGDRNGLIAYLAQREKGVLVHHIDAGACTGGIELAVGRTTRGGLFEASFNATLALDDAGKVRRILMARTPEVALGD
ncbi:hypothetical protein KEK_17348 [Mycolicibacterium thermoresistibile ATCC 19527]|uniref:SnoaL-like domain-containing protein n=1 Tax=Mycolicibacterium thermoresistibile (strain ATCC 19527 / DSM 44167 / CIP 105390 / JCM 6362 / NCTC 10409 / 316) TaxID=1078020 RepID=G7CJ89_MYCT3|nr:hypothetical protein KEK_17348 [Mycolicibacterium thermoresistibile ATCC 19527]